MTQTQSSLLGGENTPLHDGGTGSGVLPQRDVIATPNPLATPIRPVNGAVSATPLRTPRDTLAINQNYNAVDEDKLALQKLRVGFANLPKPKNDFELVLPNDVEDEEMVKVEEESTNEDAEERDRKLRVAREAELLAALNRRSQVLQRHLPRPKNINVDHILSDISDPIRKLVAEEMAQLVLHEASKYPLSDTRPPIAPSNFAEFSSEEMGLARAEITKELASPEFNPKSWKSLVANIESIPSTAVEAQIMKSAPVGNKLEKKLSMTLKGYKSRQDILSGKIKEVTEAIEQARIDLEIYRALQVGEETTAPLRVAVRYSS
jgi:pre-mRNA-splicing factor CDC5/CEF1